MLIRKKLVGKVLEYEYCSEIYIQGYNSHRCEQLFDYDCHYSVDSIAELATFELFYKYKYIRVEYIINNKREEAIFDELYYWRKVEVGYEIPIVFNQITKKASFESF